MTDIITPTELIEDICLQVKATIDIHLQEYQQGSFFDNVLYESALGKIAVSSINVYEDEIEKLFPEILASKNTIGEFFQRYLLPHLGKTNLIKAIERTQAPNRLYIVRKGDESEELFIQRWHNSCQVHLNIANNISAFANEFILTNTYKVNSIYVPSDLEAFIENRCKRWNVDKFSCTEIIEYMLSEEVLILKSMANEPHMYYQKSPFETLKYFKDRVEVSWRLEREHSLESRKRMLILGEVSKNPLYQQLTEEEKIISRKFVEIRRQKQEIEEEVAKQVGEDLEDLLSNSRLLGF